MVIGSSAAAGASCQTAISEKLSMSLDDLIKTEGISSTVSVPQRHEGNYRSQHPFPRSRPNYGIIHGRPGYGTTRGRMDYGPMRRQLDYGIIRGRSNYRVSPMVFDRWPSQRYRNMDQYQMPYLPTIGRVPSESRYIPQQAFPHRSLMEKSFVNGSKDKIDIRSTGFNHSIPTAVDGNRQVLMRSNYHAIFVEGLSDLINDSKLRSHFELAGYVEAVSRLNRETAIIHYNSSIAANAALTKLNKSVLDGATLTVQRWDRSVLEGNESRGVEGSEASNARIVRDSSKTISASEVTKKPVTEEHTIVRKYNQKVPPINVSDFRQNKVRHDCWEPSSRVRSSSDLSVPKNTEKSSIRKKGIRRSPLNEISSRVQDVGGTQSKSARNTGSAMRCQKGRSFDSADEYEKPEVPSVGATSRTYQEQSGAVDYSVGTKRTARYISDKHTNSAKKKYDGVCESWGAVEERNTFEDRLKSNDYEECGRATNERSRVEDNQSRNVGRTSKIQRSVDESVDSSGKRKVPTKGLASNPSGSNFRRSRSLNEPSTVIVTNVPLDLTNAELQNAFSVVGQVVSTQIMLNSYGQHSGRAIVVFANRKLAEEAVDRFDGGDLNQNTIRVIME